MNAAAKMINQSNIFNSQFGDIRLSKSMFFHLTLILAVFISAIAVVYACNMHRLVYSELELAQQHERQLQLQWGQLLLEQASLSTPAHLERLATDKLHMMLPSEKQVEILRLK